MMPGAARLATILTMEPRPPVNKLHLAILGLALGASAAIELSWWWSHTKMRFQHAVPWTLRRRLFMRPR
jgi:hypothetical protein